VLQLENPFLKLVASRSYGIRAANKILPKCDGWIVWDLLLRYIYNDVSIAADRKRRGKAWDAKFRTRGRELAHLALEFKDHSQALSQITDEQRDLRGRRSKIELSFSTEGLGRSGDHLALFFLREYLQARSGLDVRPIDLAAILEAAHETINRRNLTIEPEGLRRKLKILNQKHPELCRVLRSNINQIVLYLLNPRRNPAPKF
jgi:hypothetical protein